MRASFRVILNATISSTALLVDTVVQFLLVSFALRRMGKEAYAVIVLGLSLENIVSLIRVGTSTATTKHIAASLAHQDVRKTSEFMSTAAGSGLVTGVLALAICLILAAIPDRLADLPAGLCHDLAWVTVLVGVGEFLYFVLVPFEGFLYAHQRFDLTEGTRLALRLVRAGAIVLAFLYWKVSPIVFVGITMVTMVTTDLFFVFFSFRLSPGLRLRPGLMRRWALGALLSFSIYLALAQAASNAFVEGAKWIIANVLAAADVTNYALVLMLPLQVALLLVGVMRVLVPVISGHSATGDSRGMQALIRRGTRAGSMLTMLAATAFVPVLTPFLALWLPPGNTWLAPHITIILLVGLISLPASCSGQSLLGLGRAGLFLTVQVAASGAALVALVLGMAVFHAGFASATVAVCVNWLVRGITQNVLGVWLTGLSGWVFLRESVLMPLLVGAPVLLAGVYASRWFALNTWLSLIAFAGATCCALLLAYALTLSKEDRRMVSDILSSLRRKVPPS